MKAAPCERWRDVSPTGAPDRSHLATCASCAGRAPLSRAESARVRGEPRFDQLTLRLTLRRVRQRILDDARGPRVERRRRASLAVSFVGRLVAVAVICGWPATRFKPAARSVVTIEGAGAQWSRLVDGDVEVLDFRRGAFAVNVQNHETGRSFVRVPDGEIRDLGTIFRVVVDGTRTEEVSVTEGRVAISVRDVPPVLLVAGDVWRRAPQESTPSPAAVHLPRDAGERSARAPAARAANGLGAEDAAYLHVLELVRAERQADARKEARHYLHRFPNGFRSDEMEQVARGDGGTL